MTEVDISSSNDKGHIIIYQTEDGLTHINVKIEDETIWLTQAQLCAYIKPASLT